ncbi:MAG: type II secretion system protein [Firmicutes bacterium]|nr:type II secretion system protein [Bacillota bacterium]
MKRGFTLIEIMAVITILGIIGVIAVVAVDKTVKDNNERLYKAQLSNIEDAARTWGHKNIKYLPDNLDEAISIPLVLLKKEGLIDKNIKNSKTGELFFDDMYIDITYQNGIYSYTVADNSGSKNLDSLDTPVIIFKNVLNPALTLDEEFEDGALLILRDGTVVDIETDDSYVNIDSKVVPNRTGEYDYTITVTDGKSFTVNRKITIK